MTVIALFISLWQALSCRETARVKIDEESVMFGKPEWFVKKHAAWGIHPKTWQGWLYTLAWAGLISAPLVTLATRQQWAEAGIWLLSSVGLLAWDVRQVIAGIQAPAVQSAENTDSNDIMYVVDQNQTSRLETNKFDMHIQ